MNETLEQSTESSVALETTVYEFARAASIEGWWWWALLLVSTAVLIFGSARFYRRDTAELSRSVSITLIFLRLAMIVALLFFFFDLQRRTQREILRPSEVVVLVDTSQSMSLAQSDAIGSESRAKRAAELLAENELVERLGQQHRVSVYSFGDAAEPLLLQSGGGTETDAEPEQDDAVQPATSIRQPSPVALTGLILLGVSLALSLASLLVGGLSAPTSDSQSGGGRESLGWLLGVTAVTMCVGILLCGWTYSSDTSRSFASLIGLADYAPEPTDGEDSSEQADPAQQPIKVLNWEDAIAASASQSRIGDAITNVLASHDPTTLAGIVVMTDGQNNGGSNVASAMALAKRSEVSVYPVGLGSSKPPTNVRVVDLDAPKRVYPNDKFAVSAVLQGTGGDALAIEVQLLDGLDATTADGNASNALPTEVIDSQSVKLTGDGSLVGIKFELEPRSVGRRRLAIRILPVEKDQNQKDDVSDARYEVVARKLRVLTIAGGPTREYRFVRNLLHREKSIRLDTWLQTGQPGMSQDADQLLTEFPSTPAELFEYDAIAMFDPDWTQIPAASIELLDRWLASQSGGLIIVGGPVYHPRWLRLRTDPRVARIASFFPVTFSSRGLMMGSGREGGETAWPLEFTPEARRAEFLWVTDDPATSFEAWDSFGGVYDYVGVKAAKPIAKVYAYFSDPTTRISDSLPVYMASQFYGAGRVFFQGSGEMWRMRRESDAYFDNYYTKLIRWVSEGRLLRDSNRGLLLVDSPRAMVGDTITVRAVLTDEQFEPLTVPEVNAKLITPKGVEDVRLTPVEGESRPGIYSGRFVVRTDGNHELRLTLGDALGEEVFRQNVQVRLPTVELERPRRNDEDLASLAETTGGEYWKVEADAAGDSLIENIVGTISPQPQTTILPGTPDAMFTERRNAMLLWLIASVLTMEWVIRRLHRLA
ncbi:VWA domain-containing protein [Stieleria sp. ICT_E10.1]|uniref:VWA domain-containing protein n=1 Tax=Stieleria sedimenti TaxID=2976331 RepID=UPI00217FD809|nr:VWA domain-containing protein [Stieleria sedimenti]MCS7468158.1 VWA domain-containing protein [Stieleria sedimenti]